MTFNQVLDYYESTLFPLYKKYYIHNYPNELLSLSEFDLDKFKLLFKSNQLVHLSIFIPISEEELSEYNYRFYFYNYLEYKLFSFYSIQWEILLNNDSFVLPEYLENFNLDPWEDFSLYIDENKKVYNEVEEINKKNDTNLAHFILNKIDKNQIDRTLLHYFFHTNPKINQQQLNYIINYFIENDDIPNLSYFQDYLKGNHLKINNIKLLGKLDKLNSRILLKTLKYS